MRSLIISTTAHTNVRLHNSREKILFSRGPFGTPLLAPGESIELEVHVPEDTRIDGVVIGSNGDCDFALDDEKLDIGKGKVLTWYPGCGYACPLIPGQSTLVVLNNGDSPAQVALAVACAKIKEK